MNMNATTTINIVPQTELPELNIAENRSECRQATRTAAGATTAPLRHGALIGIVLLLVSLAFSVQMSLNEINAEMEMIRANLMLPVKVSTR